jgi:hypothetical protein
MRYAAPRVLKGQIPIELELADPADDHARALALGRGYVSEARSAADRKAWSALWWQPREEPLFWRSSLLPGAGGP